MLMLPASVWAQSAQRSSTAVDKPARQVVASTSGNSIRFSSLGELMQVRLEVIGPAGDLLLDTDFKQGNLIDWPALDKQGQRLADGPYLCIITVKDSSGELTRRQAIAVLGDQSLGLKQVDGLSLSVAQTQAAGSMSGEDVSMTILEPTGSSSTAVLAHDGSAAHLISSSGGLLISSGDFFANRATEKVRITAEGSVGIGTSNPHARLDVAGAIRTSEGIIFPDGSIQFSAARRTFGAASLRPDQSGKNPSAGQEHFEPQAAGTGTQNRLAKWTDNAGTLGDSVVSDTGFVTIDSNANPQAAGLGSLVIQGNVNKERIELRSAGAGPGPALQGKGFGGTIAAPTATLANSDLFIIGGSGHNGTSLVTFNAGTIKIKAEENWTGTANGAFINFETTSSGSPTGGRAERMRITSGGNVGIGLTAPQNKLTVVDTSGGAQIRFGKAANAGGGYLLSVLGSEATLSGGGEFDGTNWIARNAQASRIENRVGIVSFFTNSGLTPGSTFIPTERMRITNVGNVGIGTTEPASRLEVNGDVNVQGAVHIGMDLKVSSIVPVNFLRIDDIGSGYVDLNSGKLTFTNLPNTGNSVLCYRTTFTGGLFVEHTIDGCGSSIRLKKNIDSFSFGLSLIKRLRPVSFDWKSNGKRDIGLIAEDVDAVEPLLATRNDKGEVAGVKYEKLPVVLINAVKEQQAQIEQQDEQIRTQRALLQQQQAKAKQQESQLIQQRAAMLRQQTEIDALKRLVCAGHRRWAVCRQRR